MAFLTVFEDILGLQDVNNNFLRHTGGGGVVDRAFVIKWHMGEGGLK